ncbi:MAG TPA: c-type cytochrome [Flavobacterium sp.]|nr:c-type cytochrome [Flavobacterium sp.]
MKKLVLLSVSILVMISCGKKENPASDFSKPTSTESTASESSYNPELGEGKFDKIDLPETLDHEMAALGEIASGTKCLSCHKLTSERLVGPGWAGVTERRTPEWIMNFITNPDPMIDKDPELQAQLEVCLVRMPNQNISDDEARQILEFMRKNDNVN